MIVLFYLFYVDYADSQYYEGIGLTLYSDYGLEEFLSYPEHQNFTITKIDDEDLANTPELKNLIDKAMSSEFPRNESGRVPITFEELDNFQNQYATILSKKYNRNLESFFSVVDGSMPEEFLTKDPNVYLRTFEGGYFELEGKQYGIGPDRIYIPFMEDEDGLRLDVYETNGPLRKQDHTWADLTSEHIDIKPKILEAINDIGKHQENIKVQSNGLSPSTIAKYEGWYKTTIESFLFEYKERVFSLGFWIA